MEDESLETIDPLLLHLFSGDDSDLLPAPAPSLYNPVIQINVDALPLCPEDPHRTISLSLFVDARPGCGGITWPAGEVLANYIARRGPALHGLNVLELGSGTGLVGLVAGCLGARVCITDQAPLIQIMERNISLNKLQLNVTAVELDWCVCYRNTLASQPVPLLHHPVIAHTVSLSLPDLIVTRAKPLPDLQRPDMILAADCVYFEPAFPLLVSTLVALVPLPPERAPEVLFCYKKRRKADKRFFALLKKHFTWSVVDDDPARERYSREAISLLRLFRRTPGQLRSVSDCGRATLVG